MTKWKSKITGDIYNVFDSFSSYDGDAYKVALFLKNDNFDTDRPRARFTYAEFVEAFERVEDDLPELS